MARQEFWEAAFSSETDQWETPARLIRELATAFPWDLDVCASRPNVCQKFFVQDSLNQEWIGLCWMNPPYGDEIAQWVEKARLSLGATVVCLLPARTDTQWWQDNVSGASLVVFIKGRLKFGGAKDSAPFPSAFMVFGELSPKQKDLLCSWGWFIAASPSRQPNKAMQPTAQPRLILE